MLKDALEEKVLTLLCYSKKYAPEIARQVTADIFPSNELRTIAAAALDYVNTYGEPPGNELYGLLAKKIAGRGGSLLEATLDGMREYERGLNRSFAMDKFNEFVQLRLLTTAMHEVEAAIERCDVEGAKKALQTQTTGLRQDTKQRTVVRIRASEIKMKAIDWCWEPWLAYGKSVIFAGPKGVGKSRVMMRLAATVSTGGTWPDGSRAREGRALIISGEDSPDDTIVPLFRAYGAKLANITIMSAMKDVEGKVVPWSMDNIDELRRSLAEEPADMVIIDPIGAFIPLFLDSHKDAPTRYLMRGVSDLAAELHFVLAYVAHVNKNEGAQSINRVMGTAAFVNAPRGAFAICHHPERENCGVLVPIEVNIGAKPRALQFHIEALRARDDDGFTVAIGGVVWDRERPEISADEALSRPTKERDQKIALATTVILHELMKGFMQWQDIVDIGAEQQVSAATMRLARDRLSERGKLEWAKDAERNVWWRIGGFERAAPGAKDARCYPHAHYHLTINQVLKKNLHWHVSDANVPEREEEVAPQRSSSEAAIHSRERSTETEPRQTERGADPQRSSSEAKPAPRTNGQAGPHTFNYQPRTNDDLNARRDMHAQAKE